MDQVRLGWERPGPRLRPRRTVAVAGVEVAAFADGGGRIVLAVAHAGGSPAVVSLWDSVTGQEIGAPLSYPAEAVEAMVVLPAAGDKVLLAVVYRDVDGPLVQVWDPVAGERVGEPLPGPADGAGIAVLPSSHLLAVVAEEDGRLRLWDPVGGRVVLGPLPPADMWAVAATSELLTLHGDEEAAVVRSWDPVSGEQLRRVLGSRQDEANPARLAALPLEDGRLVLAVTRGDEDDGFVTRLWDAATGKKIGGPIEGDGLLPIPGGDGTVKLLAAGGGLWDPSSGRRVGDAGANGVPRPLAAWPGPDDSSLLAGPGPDGSLWVWDAAAPRPRTDAERVGSVAQLTPIALPDGRTLMATNGTSVVIIGGPVDDTVRFWDAASGEPVGTPLGGHAGGVTAMASAALPDGRVVLVTCDGTGAIRSWDPVTGELVAEVLVGKSNVVRSLAAVAMPDGRTLLAVGNDVNVLRLRDPATLASASDMFTRLDRPALRALAAVPLADGRTLVAAGSATPARGGSWATRLWDPVTGQPVGEPLGDKLQVWSLAATPGLLAVGTGDGTRIYDVLSRELLGELPGNYPCLADGMLAVARQDEVQFWDPTGHQRLASRRMGSTVLALTAVGSRLAVGCADGLAVLEA